MPGQLPPLTREEEEKYEVLMQKSVRRLREEAKQAKLSAGAKTKAELAYSMVKEKKPHRKRSNSSEDPPPPNPGLKGKGLDRPRGTPYLPPRGVASHPQPQPFSRKLSPAQLLADADARASLFKNGSLEDELNRPGSVYRAGKEKPKEDAGNSVTYALKARQVISDSGREALERADHGRQDHVSVPEPSHPSPGCILRETALNPLTPQGLRRSCDDEGERAHPRQKLYQSPLHDECFYVSSQPSRSSSAERGRYEYVIEDQGGWPRSTQRLEQSPLPREVHDGAIPSPVIYHPSPAFSIQPQLSYTRSTTLFPVQHWSATSGHLCSYPAPSYEEHASEALDNARLPRNERSEENRTLPPIREALAFLSWP